MAGSDQPVLVTFSYLKGDILRIYYFSLLSYRFEDMTETRFSQDATEL